MDELNAFFDAFNRDDMHSANGHGKQGIGYVVEQRWHDQMGGPWKCVERIWLDYSQLSQHLMVFKGLLGL